MRVPCRALLRASVIGTSSLTTGCLVENSTTPAGTSTSVAPSGALRFTARVVTQSSADTPATIRTTVANTNDGEVKVGTGPTLVFRAHPGAFEYGLLLYPETFIGPNQTPDEPSGGCWRYTDDNFLVQDVREWHELAPEETLTERHHVYTIGSDRRCLPTGEFQFRDDDVVLGEDARRVGLTVVLTIHDNSQVTVAPRAGTEPS